MRNLTAFILLCFTFVCLNGCTNKGTRTPNEGADNANNQNTMNTTPTDNTSTDTTKK